jgi:hypothetical protein
MSQGSVSSPPPAVPRADRVAAADALVVCRVLLPFSLSLSVAEIRGQQKLEAQIKQLQEANEAMRSSFAREPGARSGSSAAAGDRPSKLKVFPSYSAALGR